MNRQQQRKLKKHPLIRLIRGIVRLMRVIFSPAKPNRRLPEIVHPVIDPAAIERAERERAELERAKIAERAELERQQLIAARERELAEKYITVGALLDRVQWKFPEPLVLDVPAATKLDIVPSDVSRN